MAQLKTTTVSGSLTATDTITATTLNGTLATSNLSGQVAITNGGTGLSNLGTAGQVLTVNSGATALTWTTPSNGVSLSAQSSETIYLTGATSASSTNLKLSTASIDSNGYLTATRVYNAVWNDYAEYRRTLSGVKAGHCVVDNDDGSLSITNNRLLPAAQIVSDTWGHIMGETENAKTPIAVAGRVLAYTYQLRENYHAGMAVCSAPGGTVDIMTREEIKEYPDCIVGYVSEIPQYEEWGSGHIKVDGRIWIRVK